MRTLGVMVFAAGGVHSVVVEVTSFIRILSSRYNDAIEVIDSSIASLGAVSVTPGQIDASNIT
jgi:hypothetical protein